MRIPNSLRLRYRRLVNDPGRYTQGLTTTRCTKAMVGLINQVAEEAADRLGRGGGFRVLVNSVLRTEAYQDSLACIGYVAPRYSAHLAGYAVDVEKRWYEHHDAQAHRAIEATLAELFAGQVVNLIEEGTHWHVCLAPDQIDRYEELAEAWDRKAGQR
jgi:hypothetical protein